MPKEKTLLTENTTSSCPDCGSAMNNKVKYQIIKGKKVILSAEYRCSSCGKDPRDR